MPLTSEQNTAPQPGTGHLNRDVDDSNIPARRKILRIIWYVVFIGCAALLLARFFLAHSSGQGVIWPVFVFLTFSCLIYMLFLLEGIQVVAIQLKAGKAVSGDEDATKPKISARKMGDSRIESAKTNLVHFFFPFIVGRQFLVIATVVGEAMLLSTVKADPETISATGFFSSMQSNYIASVLNNDVSTFLVATALPYWIAQLLSQFLADNRSMAFLRLPFATRIVSLTLFVSRLGVGLPALALESFLSRTKHFGPESSLPR